MLNFNPHEMLDQTAIALFEHEHVWFHVVAHVVLVIMPVGLLFLLIRWLFILVNWYFRVQPIKHRARDLNNSLELPVGLMGFILKYSGRSQIILAFLALSILPITYAQLELPKRIINGASGSDILTTTIGSFTSILDQVDYLLLLSGLFLAALMVSACLKYILNLKLSTTTERLLRHIRLLILRKRITMSNPSGGTRIVPVLTQEVEPVCSFSGDSVIVPLLHGGTVVTIITFMMIQNVALGAAALTLLPIQLIIIPKLQRKVNHYVRLRVGMVRDLSDALQPDDKQPKRKQIRGQFKGLYGVRLSIFKLKYLMKSLNKFIMNLTPFFFYTIGGYLVLEQLLTLGALVASLASYKDLGPAIRELFNYYQRNEDARIRYFEIREYMRS